MVIPAGRGDDDELTVRYSDIGEMVEEIRKKASMAGVKFMWYSPTPLCLFNPIPAGLGNKGCSACEGLLSVDPEAIYCHVQAGQNHGKFAERRL